MSIICYNCGNVEGPWIKTEKGFLCEDCEEKIEKKQENNKK